MVTITVPRFLRTVLLASLAALLQLLEPIVRWVLSTMMVLGFLVAVVFELSAVGPQFPFLAVAAASLACGFVLVVFYWLSSLVAE